MFQLKNKLKITALLFLLATGARAQQIAPLGKWTSYLSYRDVLEVTNRGDIIYAITPGGIFTHDLTTSEVNAFSTVNGISTINPTSVYYAPNSDYVFVGFLNGMINFFRDPADGIRYITDIHRSESFTSKTIYEFIENGNFLYIATDFGIVVYDISREETRFSITKIGTNNTGAPVKDIAIFDDTLWAACGASGLYYAPLNSPNLTVPTVWQKESGTHGLPENSTNYLAQNSQKLFALVEDTVFRKDVTGWVASELPLGPNPFYYLTSNENAVIAVNQIAAKYILPDGTVDSLVNYGTLNSGWYHDGKKYLCDHYVGLLKRVDGDYEMMNPDGPGNNYISEIALGKKEFYVAPRGRKGPSDRHFDKSGIFYFSLETGWKNLSQFTGELDGNGVAQDFSRAYYDPATEYAYLGSWGDGILVLHHGDTVRSYEANNSPISTAVNVDNNAKVGGMAVDGNGTLWIALMLSDFRLNALDAEGNWHYFSQLNNGFPVGMVIDDYGTKWVISNQAGLMVFNENGTLDNPGDDRFRTLTSGSGNGGLPNNTVFSIAKDLDGQVWVGTSEGATVFYDPGSVFNTNFQDASCPYVDGFCLLRDQRVNTIAVDGANRKWMGTDNGAYLISADGTEQLLHFDSENSPLLDNVIIDIVINPMNGEVMFGTQSGIISWMGDATDGAANSDSLRAFPNPVRVDYTGSVSIRGSVAEAKVKITNASGMVVRELPTNGGQATWDLRDAWGNLVTPGIYLAMTADKSGQGAGITKIAVLERAE